MTQYEPMAGEHIRRAVKSVVEMANRGDERVECAHKWVEAVDSQFNGELFTDVRCSRCGVSGQRTEATGEVYWPAT